MKVKKLKTFKDLIVWQLASEFSRKIASLTKTFPKKEQYILADNLLRAARPIPANIAEGWGRLFPKEKISFYNIANASAVECSNHIIEALNNGYINQTTNDQYQKRVRVITIKLNNLIISTRKRIKSSGAK